MILEPKLGECPECGNLALTRSVSWINSPDEPLELGEVWFCKCNHSWIKSLDKNKSEVDIL